MDKNGSNGLKMMENILHFGTNIQMSTGFHPAKEGEMTVANVLSHEKTLPTDSVCGQIELAIAGDLNAMECLYEKFFRDVFRIVYRQCSNKEITEEIVNDTFITAFKRLGTLKDHNSFRSWLFSIAINHVRNRRRIEYKNNTVEIEDIHIADRTNHPIMKTALQEAIQRLPLGYREVFLLHDADGFTHQEISKILNISEGTSKSQLFKARNMLRNYFLEKKNAKQGVKQ